MTSTSTKVSRVPSGSPVPSPSSDFDSLKKVLDSLHAVANSDSAKAATGLLNQTNALRAQLKDKNSEILNLQHKLEKQEERKHIAVKEISAALDQETLKQQDAETRNDSLQKDLAKEKQRLKDVTERCVAVEKQIGVLQMKNRGTEETLKSSQRENKILDGKLNDQRNDIEVLKATNLSFEEALASEKSKGIDLESQRQDIIKKLQSVQSELDSIRGFCLRRDIDKKIMFVISLRDMADNANSFPDAIITMTCGSSLRKSCGTFYPRTSSRKCFK